MTEQQTRPLADIVAEAQKRYCLSFDVGRLNPEENGERDTLRFHWTIGRIEGELSCGSAVPLVHNGIGNEVERRKVRAEFKPTMADVIASLLLDYSSASEHVDGWAWAEECGYGQGSTLADIRRLVEAHPTALRHGRFLADWFGDLMDAAMQAAAEA